MNQLNCFIPLLTLFELTIRYNVCARNSLDAEPIADILLLMHRADSKRKRDNLALRVMMAFNSVSE